MGGRSVHRTPIPNDARGMALVVALLVMGLLTLLGVTFLTISSTERTIATNEVGVAKAFHIAEAGLERAKARIKNGPEGNLDAFLPGAKPGPKLFTDVPFDDGQYSVVIEDDADETSFSPNNPNDDKNDRVFIRSTGSLANNPARKQIVALVRVVKPLMPSPRGAAEAFVTRGSSELHATSGYFDGRDWTAPPDIGACRDIANCGTMINAATTYGRFSNLNAASFKIDGGRSYGTGCLEDACAGAEKTASQEKDTSVPATRWDSFIAGMMGRARRRVHSTDLLERRTVTWGTAAVPQITVIDAAPSFDWLTVVNGVGILIIDEMSSWGYINWFDRAALNWQGIVIINAQGNYRFDTGSTGKVRIFGQLVIRAERSAQIELHNNNSFVKYSSVALRKVQDAFGGIFRVENWREVALQ